MLSKISTFLKGVISGKTDVAEQPPVQTKEVPYKVEPTPVVQQDIMTGVTYVASSEDRTVVSKETPVNIQNEQRPGAAPAKKPAAKKAPAAKKPPAKTKAAPKVQTFTKAVPAKVKPTGPLTKPAVKKRAPKPGQ